MAKEEERIFVNSDSCSFSLSHLTAAY